MRLITADRTHVPVTPGGADAREVEKTAGGARPPAREPPRAAPSLPRGLRGGRGRNGASSSVAAAADISRTTRSLSEWSWQRAVG
jgi:hypothetical protein